MSNQTTLPEGVEISHAVDDADDRAEARFFAELAQFGTARVFDKGALLIREGDIGGQVHLIQRGNVRVFADDADADADADGKGHGNGKQIIIDEHGPGDFVGEMSIDGTRRSASVMALEETHTVEIEREDLRRYIAANPDFALALIVEVSRRAKRATDSLKSMALKDVYGRIVDLLNGMAVVPSTQASPIDAGARLIPGRLNKSDIARRVGASRDMVALIMRDLFVGGYLAETDKGTVITRPLPARW